MMKLAEIQAGLRGASAMGQTKDNRGLISVRMLKECLLDVTESAFFR